MPRALLEEEEEEEEEEEDDDEEEEEDKDEEKEEDCAQTSVRASAELALWRWKHGSSRAEGDGPGSLPLGDGQHVSCSEICSDRSTSNVILAHVRDSADQERVCIWACVQGREGEKHSHEPPTTDHANSGVVDVACACCPDHASKTQREIDTG